MMKRYLWIVLALLIIQIPNTVIAALPNTVGLGHIEVCDEISNDEFIIKNLYYEIKYQSRRLKGLKYIDSGKGTPQYTIDGYISEYKLDPYWVSPKVITLTKDLHESKSHWYDNKGNKHTRTITDKEEYISGHNLGYYAFTAEVKGVLRLKKRETVLCEKYIEISDKNLPKAYEKFVKTFIKAVNKDLKELRAED